MFRSVRKGVKDESSSYRIHTRTQKRVCEPTEVSCGAIWEEVSHDDYFIADTENFEVARPRPARSV